MGLISNYSMIGVFPSTLLYLRLKVRLILFKG